MANRILVVWSKDVVIGKACVTVECQIIVSIDVGEERTFETPGCGPEVVEVDVYVNRLDFGEYAMRREDAKEWFGLADRIATRLIDAEEVGSEAMRYLARTERDGCRHA